MNSNYRMARQLIRLARLLVAKNWTSEIQRKRPDLDAVSVNDIIQGYHNAKKEKMVAYWLLDRKSDLDRNCDFDFFEDEDEIDKAFQMLERQHLDYQKFSCPKEVLNRDDKSTVEISKRIAFNPDHEPAFFNRKSLGHGITVYWVKNDKDGQVATRKAIDADFGFEANPWCLAARKDGFDPEEVEQLTEAQKEKLGFYSDDALSVGWNFWNSTYTAYPKRIAFQNGRLLAFSAGSKHGLVEWWNRNDKPFWYIPGTDGLDDREFLEQYGKKNLSELRRVSQEEFEAIMNDSYYCNSSSLVITQDMINKSIEKNDQKLLANIVRKCENLSDRDLMRIYRIGDENVKMTFCNLGNGRKAPAGVVDMILFESGEKIRQEYLACNLFNNVSANSMRRLYAMFKESNDMHMMMRLLNCKSCPKELLKQEVHDGTENFSMQVINGMQKNNKYKVFGEMLQQALDDNDIRTIKMILANISEFKDKSLFAADEDGEKDRRLKMRIRDFVFYQGQETTDEIMEYLSDHYPNCYKPFLSIYQIMFFRECGVKAMAKAIHILSSKHELLPESVDIAIGKDQTETDIALLTKFLDGYHILDEKKFRKLITRNRWHSDLIDQAIGATMKNRQYGNSYKTINVPEDIIALFARKSSDAGKLKLVSCNVNDYPAYVVDILANSGNHKIWHEIARFQHNISKETGLMMARSNDDSILMPLAANQHVPPAVLIALSESDNEKIIRNVAENPHTPHDALRKIYDEKGDDKSYLMHLSRNRNLPRDLVNKILVNTDDEYDDMRHLVFANFGDDIPWPTMYYVMTHHMSDLLQYRLSSLGNLSHTMLEQFSRSPVSDIRANVARNPNTTLGTIIRLSNDPDKRVSEAARKNKRYSTALEYAKEHPSCAQ